MKTKPITNRKSYLPFSMDLQIHMNRCVKTRTPKRTLVLPYGQERGQISNDRVGEADARGRRRQATHCVHVLAMPGVVI